MKKYLILLLLLLATLINMRAQPYYTKKYIDENWKPTTKENATYYRLIKYDKKGKPVDVVKDYYVNTGTLQGESHMLSENPDVLDGEVITYYKSGALQSKGLYKKGVPIATAYVYELHKFLNTKNSYLSRTIVYDSNNHSAIVYSLSEFNEHDTTGVCHLENNLLHGAYWSRNGSHLEYGTYDRGKRNGKRTVYSLISIDWKKNDTILIEEENYIEDKLDGVQKMYFHDERKKQTRLYSSRNYKNGLLEGESVLYYDWYESPEKNQIRDSAVYMNGKLVGAKYLYNRTGDLDCKHIITENVDYCLRGDSIESFSVTSDFEQEKLALLSMIEDNGIKYFFRTLNKSQFGKISTVILPNSVKKIAASAFHDGINLRTIVLPDSIEEIDFYAYKGTQIRSIRIPSSVRILNNPFLGADNLMQIELDPNNKYICLENDILFNKDKTKLIAYLPKKQDSIYVVPTSVLEIGGGAFYKAHGLKKIITNNKLRIIGDNVFSNCNNLKEIEISNSVLQIGSRAFESCEKLERIKIPSKITDIKANTFASCLKLEEVILPNSLKIIGYESFAYCSSLKRIKLPSSLNLIAYRAFADCSTLRFIRIPATTNIIDQVAFQGCTSLANIEVDIRNPYFYAKDGVLYKKGDDAQPWCDPTGKVKK